MNYTGQHLKFVFLSLALLHPFILFLSFIFYFSSSPSLFLLIRPLHSFFLFFFHCFFVFFCFLSFCFVYFFIFFYFYFSFFLFYFLLFLSPPIVPFRRESKHKHKHKHLPKGSCFSFCSVMVRRVCGGDKSSRTRKHGKWEGVTPPSRIPSRQDDLWLECELWKPRQLWCVFVLVRSQAAGKFNYL